MTKSKDQPLLARAADEANLLHEIWLIAVADAFRRSLMHQVTGLNSSDVIDWYFQEHQHMKRFVDRHIEAGTCDEGIVELLSEREKNRPKRPPGLPRNPEHWMQPFRSYPEKTSARIEIAQKPQVSLERKRGPRPEKLLLVKDKMRALDRSDLASMTEEAMAAEFGASRDTCRKARNDIRSEAELSNK